jgi:hypothetical protein
MATYPEVVPAVDIPLYHVPIPLGEVGVKTMRLADLGALLIACLFVFLIMAMLGVELAQRVSAGCRCWVARLQVNSR